MFKRILCGLRKILSPVLGIIPLIFQFPSHYFLVGCGSVNFKIRNLIITRIFFRRKKWCCQFEFQSEQMSCQESCSILTYLHIVTADLGTCLHDKCLYGFMGKWYAIVHEIQRIFIARKNNFSSFSITYHITCILH